jgi:hypothetical protein
VCPSCLRWVATDTCCHQSAEVRDAPH